MTERALRNDVLKAVSRLGARLFRVNTGQAWVGKVVHNSAGSMFTTLMDARRIRMGLVTGGSDLIGWTTVTVTPKMVGQSVAVFTAIELKTGRQKATVEQARFVAAVRSAGGIAGKARSVEEAEGLIRSPHGFPAETPAERQRDSTIAQRHLR